jgi:hypothetical protein
MKDQFKTVLEAVRLARAEFKTHDMRRVKNAFVWVETCYADCSSLRALAQRHANATAAERQSNRMTRSMACTFRLTEDECTAGNKWNISQKGPGDGESRAVSDRIFACSARRSGVARMYDQTGGARELAHEAYLPSRFEPLLE